MLRELDARESDNLRVTLYWDDEANTCTVEVEDRIDPTLDYTLTDIPVSDRKAAFYHPYTYARRGRVAPV